MRKPYRIIGAYDSETTNVKDSNGVTSFPILHQLGLLDVPIEEVMKDNIEQVCKISLYRTALELYQALDIIVESDYNYVPVLLCHNLSFDMYGLAPFFNRYDVRVLAKSAKKPITFTIRDENGDPALVIWDTLIFSKQSLERMGNDAGYSKAVGEWDYELIRTPNTPLTANEIDYAKRDIYTLLVWLSWWIQRNPDIEPHKLALNVVTKTGVVRERRRKRFDSVKGKSLKYNIGRYWLYRCRMEAPKSDDELYTMQASTRGGFTFCAMNNASVPFDFSTSSQFVVGFDATSQHPAQMVSHLYPVNFKEKSPKVLDLAFTVISKVSLTHLLNNWAKPFPVAFNACFRFENLRPKKNTLFSECGIYPLASARYRQSDDDNGDRSAHEDNLEQRGYTDKGTNVKCAFGKVISADSIELYLTELTAWEVCQAYEWDKVQAIHGYSTGRFTKPSDMDVVSVMQFYEAKDAFKSARELYFDKGTIDNADDLKRLGIAPNTVEEMVNGSISDSDIEATYLSLKADLNALFGINAANEYRRDTVLTECGIGYKGNFGICNKPKNPKVWYQFGQRIVGWSRIAQICAMSLIWDDVETIVNGDTDSFKAVITNAKKLDAIEQDLRTLSNAIDKAKSEVCYRVKRQYPTYYNPLEGIGHYVHEFTTNKFCASWNKAYCLEEFDKRDGKAHIKFTLAGIPTKRRISANSCFIGIDGLADRLIALGWSFEQVCNVFLGYNVTYAHDVIRLNGRSFPEWGSLYFGSVTDYLGNTSRVAEPMALALYPMAKTVNDTSSRDNYNNLAYAKMNNPNVNSGHMLVYAGGILDLGELAYE